MTAKHTTSAAYHAKNASNDTNQNSSNKPNFSSTSHDLRVQMTLTRHKLNTNSPNSNRSKPFRLNLSQLHLRIRRNLTHQNLQPMPLLNQIINHKQPTREMNTRIRIIALIHHTVLLDSLPPNPTISPRINQLLTLLGTVKIDTVSFFIITMAKRNKIRLI